MLALFLVVCEAGNTAYDWWKTPAFGLALIFGESDSDIVVKNQFVILGAKLRNKCGDAALMDNCCFMYLSSYNNEGLF